MNDTGTNMKDAKAVEANPEELDFLKDAAFGAALDLARAVQRHLRSCSPTGPVPGGESAEMAACAAEVIEIIVEIDRVSGFCVCYAKPEHLEAGGSAEIAGPADGNGASRQMVLRDNRPAGQPDSGEGEGCRLRRHTGIAACS